MTKIYIPAVRKWNFVTAMESGWAHVFHHQIMTSVDSVERHEYGA